MTAKKQSQIKILAIASTLQIKIETKTYSFKGTKEEREKIKKAVDLYNKLPNELKRDKIIKMITPKVSADLVKTTVEKKATKQVKKVVKKGKRVINKELTTLKKQLALEEDPLGNAKNFLRGDTRFEVINDKVYLLPYTQVPLPVELVKEINSYMDRGDSLQPLINFWMLALLNPNPVARTKMFEYLHRHKMIITPNGYFVTYRMVKTQTRGGQVLPDGVYTDAHTGTMRYEANKVQRIPRSECDEDGTKDCSRGLHTGTPEFIGIKGLDRLGDGYSKGVKEVLTKAQGGGYGTGYDAPRTTNEKFDNTFGNQAIICLVNPMHVVSVPDSNTRKMRSCEFFFCRTTTAEEVINLQLSEYAIFDNQYKEFEVEEIKAMLAKANLVEWFDVKNEEAETRNKRTKERLQKKIKNLEELANTKLKEVSIGGDKVHPTLTLEEITKLIQNRIA